MCIRVGDPLSKKTSAKRSSNTRKDLWVVFGPPTSHLRFWSVSKPLPSRRTRTWTAGMAGFAALFVSSAIGVGISWSGWNCTSLLTATTYSLVGCLEPARGFWDFRMGRSDVNDAGVKSFRPMDSVVGPASQACFCLFPSRVFLASTGQ